VAIQQMGGADEASMRAEIADNNMESVALEKAPRVAVYIPPNTPPWDDAVTLALQYADIPYKTVWDEEVLRGDLSKYDWLHLHHEDFTGQHGKFYTAYHNFPWYVEETQVQQAMATKMGFAKISQLKAAVALTIKDYVGKGGFMFGMCSATDTYDIALAAAGLDIAGEIYDGDPFDPLANQKLDYSRTLAFKDFHLELDPYLYRFSDIDVTMDAAQRGPNSVFTLFDFSAKNDPVPTMLIQDHVNAVPEFLGRGHGGGEVPPRPVRPRHLYVPRRPRPRGLPAHGRRPRDGPVAVPALTRLPVDPQQRAVPRGGEEEAADVGITRPSGVSQHPPVRGYDAICWRACILECWPIADELCALGQR
jgi:hypothetical protein